MTPRDINPKDAIGSKKAPMSSVSAPFLLALGSAMLEGSLKYGRHNYREIGVRVSVYYDAAMRHLMAYWEGQDIDPESGEHHLIKAAACMAVLFDSIHRGNINDDRPPRVKDGWVEEANKRAAALVERYPEPKLPYTQRDKSWVDGGQTFAQTIIPCQPPSYTVFAQDVVTIPGFGHEIK